MAYLAAQLISRSWNLSGIVARNLQGVQGNQGSDGLFLLNELLEFTAIDTPLIPYFVRNSFTLSEGVGQYFIPNLVFAETVTFNIGSVRYPLTPALRQEFWGSARAENIESLPFQYHFERVEGGANIYVYFIPNQTYPANISGKFGLTDVTLQTDLSLTYNGAYISYLRYKLASYMCMYYAQELPASTQRNLMSLEALLADQSPPDLTLRKLSTLSSGYSLNYGIANICNGWVPGRGS